MKKIILSLVFLSLPLLGCSAEQGMAPSGANPAAAKESAQENVVAEYDFGKAKEGEILKHSFIFKNNTGKAMIIRDVTTSCGCTTSEVKKKELAPQEETTIDVQFDTKDFSGEVKKYIYVTTNDMDNNIFRYLIKAEVIK